MAFLACPWQAHDLATAVPRVTARATDICCRINRYPRGCRSVFKDDAVLTGNAVREQG